MSRRIFITGIGHVSALGIGVDDAWQKITTGHCAAAPVKAFDATPFPSTLACEVSEDFKIRDFVPKSYRKATKVMARDIELAVAAADLAVRSAGISTPGTDAEAEPSYPSSRISCHIGAGLIAADLNELTYALNCSRKEDGSFDIHHWGESGMQQLTPLWLLKYLPNMLACHVTITHNAQGPSNTITCAEASGLLSIGESLRVIKRGNADCGISGSAESKINPMGFIRQCFNGHVSGASDPARAMRPFDEAASGSIVGEGGGIVILEAEDTLSKRGGTPVAEVLGFGASQSLNKDTRNGKPGANGRGLVLAIQKALVESGLNSTDIDLVIPSGFGDKDFDTADAAALREVFGDHADQLCIFTPKAYLGNTCAGSGGLEAGLAAQCLKAGTVPAAIHRDAPILGRTELTGAPEHALIFTSCQGGQNAALVLRAVN